MRLRAPPRAVLNLLLAGFTLRYLGLERFGLWLDEGATWTWAAKPTWAETTFAEANHPPLWWLITRAFTSVFGDSEDMLRLPAALCGVATILLVWLLARRLLDPAHAPRRGGFVRTPDGGEGARMALWVTAFVAVSAFLIEVSQEARMYALLILESVGLTLLYLRWLDRADRASLIGYAVLAALALYTQYFAVWPLAALGIHALWLSWRTRRAPAEERVRLLPFAGANLVAGLLFAPWLLHLLGRYTGLHMQSYNALEHLAVMLWHVGVGPGLAVVDADRAGAPFGHFLATEGATILTTAALWLPAPILGAFALRRRPGLASLTACALLVPVGGVLALLPWFTLVHERYLVFLAPWLWLLAVLGAFSRGPRLRAVLLTSLCLVSAIGLVAYHLVTPDMEMVGQGQSVSGFPTPVQVVVRQDDPVRFLNHGIPFGKEPWREAAALVHSYAGPGDLVLLYPGYIQLVWHYYGRRFPGGALQTEELAGDFPDEQALLAQLEPLVKDRKRVFLVVSHAPTSSPLEAYRRLTTVIGAIWQRASAGTPWRLETVPPIPFRRSWGVHVAIFNRT